MWNQYGVHIGNQYGVHIVDFLTERCAALSDEHFELSHLVFKAIPSVDELPEFIKRLSVVREQLPRCEALRADLVIAAENEGRQEELLRSALESISESMEPLYCDGQVEMGEAATCALDALRSLTRELTGFSARAHGAQSSGQSPEYPDPLEALLQSRRGEA